MRCWTDGRRDVFHVGTWLDVQHGDRRHPRITVAATSDPYGCLGGLAVHPTEDVVWVCGDQTTTMRIGLDGRQTSSFSQSFADLAFVDDRLIGVTRDDDGGRRIVYVVADGDRLTLEPLEVSFPRRVRWPWGAPYQHGVYPFAMDAHASVRLHAGPHGAVVASTSGHAVVLPTGGQPYGFRFPPVYQGWVVASLTSDGLVITTLHNGRCGDVLWADRHGRWYDAFDSEWKAMGPCVPTASGFLTSVDRALQIRATCPGRALRTVDVGGYVVDVSAAPDGRAAVFLCDRGLGRATMTEDHRWIIQLGDEVIAQWDPVTDDELAAEAPRWTWSDDGEVPPMSVPDFARAQPWVDALTKAHPESRLLMLDDLRQELPPWKGDLALAAESDPAAAVWLPLLRDGLPPLTRRSEVRRLAERCRADTAEGFARFWAEHVWPGTRLPSHADDSSDDLDYAVASAWIYRTIERADPDLDGENSAEDAQPTREQLAIHKATLFGKLSEAELRWTVALTVEDDVEATLSLQAIPSEDLTTHQQLDDAATIQGVLTWLDVVADVEVNITRTEPWRHGLYAQAREPRIVVSTSVNLRGVTCDAATRDEAIAWFTRHLDVDGWFVGSRTSEAHVKLESEPGVAGVAADPDVRERTTNLVFTMFAEDLEDAQPVPAPGIALATRAFVELLTERELIAWERTPDDQDLLRLQRVLQTADATRIGDFLVELDAVDDLFASDEEILDALT